MKNLLLLSILVVLSLSGYTQNTKVTASELKDYVTFLASDSLKGRKPGTAEINVAAGFIRDHFKKSGLHLAGEDGFQWFEIVTDVKLGDRNAFSVDGYEAALKKEFIPLAYSSSASVEAPVVFAGFGLDIDTDSLKWKDYKNLDVKGKWVMVLRGDPEPDISDSKFIPFGDIRSKILTAKDLGAVGIILVSPKSLEKDDKLMPLVVENNEVTTGIPAVNITRELANKILKPHGEIIDSLESLIVRTKTPHGFEIGIKVKGNIEVVQQRQRTANVMGVLDGNDPNLKGEYLVVGGHYDHLGFGGPGSGSRMPDTNAIHNGADDNASGTAMVMALSKRLAVEQKSLKRSIIFVAFSSEEIGLIGSKYFVSHPPVDIKSIKGMFNFDMVGRFDKEKNSISVSGTGTAAESDSIVTLLEKGLPFTVVHSPDGYGPSDHASFYSSNIPVLYFNTGVHMDYHTPFDDTDKLDFNAEKVIGDFATNIILTVDQMPKTLTFRESCKKENVGRSGRRLKVTLGIMPDFAGSEKSGLRIDGVTKDGPADKGGMKKGDIITSINGMKVGNIYEYMSRLQKLKHGMTVNVEVLRNGKTEILIIQL